MGLIYKIDIVQALKDAGYSTKRIRQEKILAEATMTKLRRGEGVGWDNIEKICSLLNCQPGDIIEYTRPATSIPLATPTRSVIPKLRKATAVRSAGKKPVIGFAPVTVKDFTADEED